MLSTAPNNIFPSLSVNLIPLLLSLHSLSFSTSSNNFMPSQSSLQSSGGSFPLFMKLSKCSFSILSIPLGRDGNIESGLFHTLCCVSQKHLGHSFINPSDEGDSLYIVLLL